MQRQRCNGWENYDTWCVWTWMSNTMVAYKERTSRLEDLDAPVTISNAQSIARAIFCHVIGTEVLTTASRDKNVNWQEIAEHMECERLDIIRNKGDNVQPRLF